MTFPSWLSPSRPKWNAILRYGSPEARKAIAKLMGRAGGLKRAARLTDEQMSRAMRKVAKAAFKQSTPKQRSERARHAALALVAKLTPEQRREKSIRAGAASNRVVTREQRQEWGRKGGLASGRWKRRSKE